MITKESRENEWYYDLLYSGEEYALNVDNDEVDGASNEITVFVNCKITDEHNKTIGIVGVGIRLKHLKELLGEYEKKYDVNAYLINSAGNIEISTANSGYEQVNWFEKYSQQDVRESIQAWKDEQKNLELWTKQDSQQSYVVVRYIQNCPGI